MIEKGQLHAIIERFSSARILVVGDMMLDRFVWGNVDRISPEAPVPVVRVTRESIHLGGSANVVANLKALGATATPVGVLGQDEPGRALKETLRKQNISLDGLVIDPGLTTIEKTRIIAHNQQVVRVDRELPQPLSSGLEAQLRQRLDSLMTDSQAVIVSDYAKCVITPSLLAHLEAKHNGALLAIDPKEKNFDYYRNADIVTPNQHEAELLSGIEISDETALRAAAKRIFERLNCKRLLITLGEQGMALFRGRDDHIRIPTRSREVYDVSGAGDTVIAVYTLARTVGADDHQAAVLANAAAGVVVAKLGTATLSPEELERAV